MFSALRLPPLDPTESTEQTPTSTPPIPTTTHNALPPSSTTPSTAASKPDDDVSKQASSSAGTKPKRNYARRAVPKDSQSKADDKPTKGRTRKTKSKGAASAPTVVSSDSVISDIITAVGDGQSEDVNKAAMDTTETAADDSVAPVGSSSADTDALSKTANSQTIKSKSRAKKPAHTAISNVASTDGVASKTPVKAGLRTPAAPRRGRSTVPPVSEASHQSGAGVTTDTKLTSPDSAIEMQEGDAQTEDCSKHTAMQQPPPPPSEQTVLSDAIVVPSQTIP